MSNSISNDTFQREVATLTGVWGAIIGGVYWLVDESAEWLTVVLSDR